MKAALRLVIAVVLAAASPLAAHDRSVSYSEWQIEGGGAKVRFRIAALDASWIAAEAAPDEAPAEYFSRRLTLRAGDSPCRLTRPARALAPGDWLSFEWSVACPHEQELVIESRILARMAPGHLHFVRVRGERGTADRVLTADTPRWAPALDGVHASTALGLRDAVTLGIVHVLGGLDHLAFLAALFVGSSGIGAILALATAFTIAHSLTLALAALGHLVPDPAAIEPLIGLSIALVAAENLSIASPTTRGGGAVAASLAALAALAWWGLGSVPPVTLLGLACLVPATARLAAERRTVGRTAVAFLFGLIHGFGFAGALGEADLQGRSLMTALLGFNLGVEAGQVLVVVLLAGALAVVRRTSASTHRLVEREASVLLLALGVAWFLLRAY